MIPIFFGFKSGQEIDEKKMNRDLEIAKNILATLIKEDTESFFGGNVIEASYIKGYGVTFTIPEHLVYFHGGFTEIVLPEISMPQIPEVAPDVDVDEGSSRDRKRDQRKAEQDFRDAEQELRAAERETRIARHEIERARQNGWSELADVNDFYMHTEQNEDIEWEQIMITFLADYADLIGQLQPNDRIKVTQKTPKNYYVFVWGGYGNGTEIQNEKSGISTEVLKKDVNAFKIGKIDRKEFEKRISIKMKTPQKKVPDLEMFASIFGRYYSRDLSESYYTEGNPKYEVLEGFGVVFHTRASSRRGTFTIHSNSLFNSKKTETKSGWGDDDELYSVFKKDVKDFLLDYGRTIRSLGDDDKVILEIKFHGCRNCEIPKTLKVSTKMSTLRKYDQQKITREKAASAIEIKEVF